MRLRRSDPGRHPGGGGIRRQRHSGLGLCVRTAVPTARHTPSPVFCRGVAAALAGTDHAETLLGTPAPDVIAGLGGNDIIQGFRRR